jgi:hypothetical protein
VRLRRRRVCGLRLLFDNSSLLFGAGKRVERAQNSRISREMRILDQKIDFRVFRKAERQSQHLAGERLAKSGLQTTRFQKSKILERGAHFGTAAQNIESKFGMCGRNVWQQPLGD